MTRKQAINLIRVEVAQEGRITGGALRYMFEGKLSTQAMKAAARIGLTIRRARLERERGGGNVCVDTANGFS